MALLVLSQQSFMQILIMTRITQFSEYHIDPEHILAGKTSCPEAC